MTDHDDLRLRRDDDTLTAGLRALYAPPADEAYWDALARRIVARARADAEPWWEVPHPMRRLGLIAAGLVAAVAGALLLRLEAAERELAAAEAVIETPVEQPTLAIHEAESSRDASLRYLTGR